MSNNTNSQPECNIVDEDIAGPGVRVSFYVQTFLLVLLVDRSWQDAPVALWTFIATSFGLTLAAIINRSELVLLEAMQVSNLVWLANFGTFVALASYSRRKAASKKSGKKAASKKLPSHMIKPDYGVKYGAMLQTLFSMLLTIYMWVHASDFVHCDPVYYVFFVFKTPALTTGRTISLVFSSILTALYIPLTFYELFSECKRSQKRRKQKAEGDEEKAPASAAPPTPTVPVVVVTQHDAVSRPSAVYQVPSHSSSDTASPHSPSSPNSATSLTFDVSIPPSPRHSRRRPGRRRWSSDLDPMFVGILICQIMVFTYFIVSSEMLLNRDSANFDNDGNKFGFGQILAVVVVLPSALAVVGALRENGLNNPKKSKKKKSRSKDRSRSRRPAGSSDHQVDESNMV